MLLKPFYSFMVPSIEPISGKRIHKQVHVVEMVLCQRFNPFLQFGFGFGEIPHLHNIFPLNTLVKINVNFLGSLFHFLLGHSANILVLGLLEKEEPIEIGREFVSILFIRIPKRPSSNGRPRFCLLHHFPHFGGVHVVEPLMITGTRVIVQEPINIFEKLMKAN